MSFHLLLPCFTCACVRSHGIVTDRIGVTAVRVGGALVDICMRKWNRTRLKSHGDIYLIVYIWSLVYVTKQKKQVKVSSVSLTLHRTAFSFFHTNRPSVHTKPMNLLT